MRSLAILIALGMALALGACGRKAGLDPPPSAFAAPNGQAQASSANSLRPQAVSNPSSGATSTAPAAASAERPASPDSSDPRFAAGTQPRQKSFFLDWLIK